MLAGSNPAARTSQSQSPRSPYRGAGRLFSYPVRRFDGFLPTSNYDMRFAGSTTLRQRSNIICGSSIPMPHRLSNRDTWLSPSPIFPPLVPFSLVDASDSPIRFAVPNPYSVWRDAMPPPSSLHSLSDGRGGAVTALPPRFPIRPIGFSPSSSIRFPSNGSASPPIRLSIRTAGRACFSRTYPFSMSIPPRHVIHYPIYMRAWWNGRHARFRFWWRNLCGFESHRPHHGNA